MRLTDKEDPYFEKYKGTFDKIQNLRKASNKKSFQSEIDGLVLGLTYAINTAYEDGHSDGYDEHINELAYEKLLKDGGYIK